ncbi:substrate-binding domain-containing protein [Rariglobus hedericola]|uniref:GntR family transcriptional regulator n=1 Tax=Rariglobus hedericola TaxID=2597822 RepID=A0A556QKY2_9BACT|nr:substrate-binding domain-containing protein [Rariglobus hedericola]TSJ77288.1 GntR family transcriptional regulator [Rariglobus hedericola]
MSFGRLVNEADTRLREWLDTSAQKPGTRLPSERALAVQLGIQHYALNRAMARLISEGRVEREGYKLTVAASTRIDAGLTCHLVIAQRSVHLPSYKRVAKEMGVKLVVHTWQSADEAALALDRLDSRDTEAVIFDPPYVAPVSLWEPIAARLLKHGIPVVGIGQSSAAIYSVNSDNLHDLEIAINHLLKLGHREIGFVTAPPTNPGAIEVLYGWEQICRRNQLNKSASRIYLQTNARLKEEAVEVADLLVNSWREITALIVFSGLDYNVQLLQEQLHQKGRRVPAELSLLFIGASKSPAHATIPVTSLTIDVALLQETAFNLAQRATRKKKNLGILPPPCSVLIQSQFIARNSTRPPAVLNDTSPEPKEDPSIASHTASRKLQPPAEIARALESCLRMAYPLAAKASLSERPRFAPIDLGTLVNRPLNFRRGWLGDLPLKQFPPGPHEIHGVPFNILGGPRRSDCGAIVFHSAVNTTGNSQKLPDTLIIPIKQKVRAVYILHGCGYAKFLHPFARYRFLNRKTCLGNVPLVSLGQPPPDYNPSQQTTDAVTPNIQDWWPDFPHMDFPGARMAPIMESEEAGHLPRHVYLYTLEWINPSPDKIVDSLEVSVDATLSTTLGVLAVTVLKP